MGSDAEAEARAGDGREGGHLMPPSVLRLILPRSLPSGEAGLAKSKSPPAVESVASQTGDGNSGSNLSGPKEAAPLVLMATPRRCFSFGGHFLCLMLRYTAPSLSSARVHSAQQLLFRS